MEATLPYDSNGNASLVPGYKATDGQDILSIQHNPPLEDIAKMLSQVMLRDGRTPMGGHLNMNGFRVRNLPDATEDADPATFGQLAELQAVVNALVPTGMVLGFRRTTAPAGWVKENGGTIGSASSGATNRANADTQTLFRLLWEQFNNTVLPIQDSAGAATTRGASAAADFTANKRMPLFDSRSRFQRGADDGLGFDTGLTVGATQADGIKNHKHPGATTAATVSVAGLQDLMGAQTGGGGARMGPTGSTNLGLPALAFTTNDNTDGIALETRPRSTVLLFCIKL